MHYIYFINVKVAPNVYAIVTDSSERRMPFPDREMANRFARQHGLIDYSIEQSLYSAGYAGYA
ncbi:MAG: hypothetical protein Tp1125DCM00d2C21254131_34 [Prokaryotic dsDNA virus sp.]|nr:MAG: hypothetical protein Tp1125DCM00d2C21254131_34 [Prokaryotic dsDNA virus sp.]